MKNKEYVPGEGDTYWCIDLDGSVFSTTNTEGPIYARILEFGNYFRTEKEAEAAAEKVRASLLSLHNNYENLQESIQDMVTNTCQAMDKGKDNVAKATCSFGPPPKLTPEVFDSLDCPEWAKYAAVDENGCAYWYPCKPDRFAKFFRAIGWNKEKYKIIPGKFDAADWKNSIIERPVKENKLPEWCKVGAVGYNPETGFYFSVDNIDGAGISLRYPYGSDNKSSLTFDYFKECCPIQARLRPYTPEELEGLVGQVIKYSTDIYLVSVFETQANKVRIVGEQWDANELLTHWTHRDGRPCGKLEHLEGKEWVE